MLFSNICSLKHWLLMIVLPPRLCSVLFCCRLHVCHSMFMLQSFLSITGICSSCNTVVIQYYGATHQPYHWCLLGDRWILCHMWYRQRSSEHSRSGTICASLWSSGYHRCEPTTWNDWTLKWGIEVYWCLHENNMFLVT